LLAADHPRLGVLHPGTNRHAGSLQRRRDPGDLLEQRLLLGKAALQLLAAALAEQALGPSRVPRRSLGAATDSGERLGPGGLGLLAAGPLQTVAGAAQPGLHLAQPVGEPARARGLGRRAADLARQRP